MNAPLYTVDILRLAAAIASDQRLADPMGSSERRSPVCGSRVAVDVDLDRAGRISALGMMVRACALGQASASLMASAAVGRSPRELAATRDGLAAWLSGAAAAPPDWPGLDIFAPALPYHARHASIRLAFEAAAEAAAQAAERAEAA